MALHTPSQNQPFPWRSHAASKVFAFALALLVSLSVFSRGQLGGSLTLTGSPNITTAALDSGFLDSGNLTFLDNGIPVDGRSPWSAAYVPSLTVAIPHRLLSLRAVSSSTEEEEALPVSR